MLSLRFLFRAAVAALLLVAIASLIPTSTKATTNRSTAPVRGYYLTTGAFTGSQALNACASGYHMASLYEIHELSNLSYNTTLGVTAADSGSGPPADTFGWIRTGASSGVGNCNAWTDNSSSNTGTAVALTSNWNSTATQINPWTPGPAACSAATFVWCVEN